MTKKFFVFTLMGVVLFSSTGRAMDGKNPSSEELTRDFLEDLTEVPSGSTIIDVPDLSGSSPPSAPSSPLNSRANTSPPFPLIPQGTTSGSGLPSPSGVRIIEENRGRKRRAMAEEKGNDGSGDETRERILIERHYNRCRNTPPSPLEDN